MIDLSEVFEGREPQELMVNSIDAHPNEKVHREVAGLIYDRLQAARID